MRQNFLQAVIFAAAIFFAAPPMAAAVQSEGVQAIEKVIEIDSFDLFGLKSRFAILDAVAVDDSTQTVLLADSPNRTIYRYNLEGRPLDKLPGKLPFVQDMAIRPDGFLAVALKDGTINAYDKSLRLVNSIHIDDILKDDDSQEEMILDALPEPSKNDRGKEGVGRPLALASSRRGALYILDKNNNKVIVLDEAGKPTLEFGEKGDREGQFLSPQDIAVDEMENIYVLDADRLDFIASVFNKRGKYLYSLERTGPGMNDLAAPTAIEVDTLKRVWIVDSASNVIRVTDSLGGFLFEWDGTNHKGAGFDDHFFNLKSIAFDKLGKAYLIEGAQPTLAIYDVR